ncbi:hypothetical protein AURDEDRAFT_166474 [Auricularia subglabra TFB-10046 SS5]|nr:hypothetical protein AURDEDRAFT_166474 [Auricularia subglabra TFB-10046 SS5]
MPPPDSALLVVFYAFSLAGQLVLAACLLTVRFARLRRDVGLINVAVAGLVFATACLLLLFANEFRGSPPQFSLCLAQACLIYGSLAMITSSLWYSLREILMNISRNQSNSLGIMLKILPCFSFYTMCLASLVDGLRDRKAVNRSRDFFFCSASPRVGYASMILCGTFMLVSLLLELHVAYMIVYSWKTRALRREALPLVSIVRLGLFRYARVAKDLTTCLRVNMSHSDRSFGSLPNLGLPAVSHPIRVNK